jgi:hypothetical protein
MMADAAFADSKMHLWVVEATADLPVCLKADTSRSLSAMYVSLGGVDPDGFVEMRPIDAERATSSVFWSAQEPIAYECRALVRAPEAALALMRGKELFEHLADRLTLLTGYPVRTLNVGYTYDEDMLRQCISGEIREYDATTGGQECFKTQLPKNAHFQQLLIPPKSALEAIRWFRRGMTATMQVDQYLFYYIALESIAKHVPGVARGPRRNSKGEEQPGLETHENAAIRYLISRHSSLPPKAKNTLATIRARIAHGNADLETLELASANLPALQRLVADGIALVYGVDPARFNVLTPSPVKFLAPLLRAQYSPEEDPRKRWGGLLSDAFARYMEAAKVAAPQEAPQPPNNALGLSGRGGSGSENSSL